MYLKDAQIRLLETSICSLALELKEIRPAAHFEIEDMCPKLKSKVAPSKKKK